MSDRAGLNKPRLPFSDADSFPSQLQDDTGTTHTSLRVHENDRQHLPLKNKIQKCFLSLRICQHSAYENASSVINFRAKPRFNNHNSCTHASVTATHSDVRIAGVDGAKSTTLCTCHASNQTCGSKADCRRYLELLCRLQNLMTLNSLSPMVTNVQLSGCPAKASLQVATHVPQLLHLSYWRPLAQIQSARRCATHRAGRLSAQASVTQTQTQDLAKSQKVMWQTCCCNQILQQMRCSKQ